MHSLSMRDKLSIRILGLVEAKAEGQLAVLGLLGTALMLILIRCVGYW